MAFFNRLLGPDAFTTPYILTGTLKGLDLSPDGRTLIVADASGTATNIGVHVIDLATGQSRRAACPNSAGEGGTFAVAFGNDGAALVTSRGGMCPLRRYDPVSDTWTVVANWLRQDAMVSSSGDGSTLIIAESGTSNGPMDIYDVATRTILRTGSTGHFNYEAAASRDGALMALPTYFGTLIYDRSFNLVTTIGTYAGAQPSGAAFHPAADAVFFPFVTTTYVRAYSTTTWQLLGQFDFKQTFTTPGNHAFGNGRIRISPDGQVIFATVPGGVSYVRHGLSLPLTHRLFITGSPLPVGAPTPFSYGSYWLDDGTWVTVDVPSVAITNGVAYFSAGWTGTGSAAGNSTGTEAGFYLNANAILTWNWNPLAVSASVVAAPGGNQMLLQWPSVDGTAFEVLYATNSLSAFVPIASDLYATPPTNTFQALMVPAHSGFYKVRLQ